MREARYAGTKNRNRIALGIGTVAVAGLAL